MFAFSGRVIGHGRERAREELASDSELAGAIKHAIHPIPKPLLASVGTA